MLSLCIISVVKFYKLNYYSILKLNLSLKVPVYILIKALYSVILYVGGTQHLAILTHLFVK